MIWSIFLQVWGLIILPAVAPIKAHNDPIVETKQGKISGTQLPILSGYVTAYLGIPYGEPPTGNLRFKKTDLRKPWHGVFKANKFGKSCFQYKREKYTKFPGTAMWLVNNEMNEDCLHLNVWVPSSRPYPMSVMVFIHGGGFESGTTSLDIYDGSMLAYEESVIVVSINYRVGALGFLALPGYKEAPGNAGLFDQRLGLKWIHENIASFGGNPDSVTIFGHSAGGASVGFHLISPVSHAYFTRAIMQSGTTTSSWTIHTEERAKHLTLKLAESLDCPSKDYDAIMACLIQKDPVELINKQQLVREVYALTNFLPVIDNDFLNDLPESSLKQIFKKDILLGITKDDGNPFTLLSSSGVSLESYSGITSEKLQESLKMFFPSAGDLGVESILQQYKVWENEGNGGENHKALQLILRDYYFTCPMTMFAENAVKHQNNVFVYEYHHRLSNDPWPEWMGALHGAELAVLFGKPLINNDSYPKDEHLLSKRMMKFWANFARTGSPNGDVGEGFVWPLYSTKEEKYVALYLNGSDVHQKLSSHCQFWNSYFPSLLLKL
ncbi:hypothetical protein GDO86_016424, partial [Hymenochirus boettgeri]